MDIGVIGAGVMGSNHVRIYSEMRAADAVYIYDVDEKAAKALGEKHDVNACDSMQALLSRVDAVSICAPTRYHFDIAKEAIENGINCLIEKPITLSSKEGEALIKIAEDLDNGQVVGVGHIERFNPIVAEIKKLITNPRYIEIRRHNPGSNRIKDANVVIDLMIHDIDLVWNCFFEGYQDYELYSAGDKDLFKKVARFDGCLASLSASRIACKKIRTIHVEEEEFTIDGDFMAQELYIHSKPERYGEVNTRYAQENIIEKVLINRVEPLKEELRTFLDCSAKGRKFPVTPSQAVLNLKIAENRGLRVYSCGCVLAEGNSNSNETALQA
jgi:predicted dehydrogenase